MEDRTVIGVEVLRLRHGQGLALPSTQSSLAAGMDLAAAIPANGPLTLAPGERALVPTGFALALPPGFEGQVRPRSGLAVKHGITVLNSPGTIDADYRGEIRVPIINLGSEAFTITRGMRIAQLVVAPVVGVTLIEVDALDDTGRGSSGFGSTGVSG
jgi:dUTP pyrophosphatase